MGRSYDMRIDKIVIVLHDCRIVAEIALSLVWSFYFVYYVVVTVLYMDVVLLEIILYWFHWR
jgi:hypothetical protein